MTFQLHLIRILWSSFGGIWNVIEGSWAKSTVHVAKLRRKCGRRAAGCQARVKLPMTGSKRVARATRSMAATAYTKQLGFYSDVNRKKHVEQGILLPDPCSPHPASRRYVSRLRRPAPSCLWAALEAASMADSRACLRPGHPGTATANQLQMDKSRTKPSAVRDASGLGLCNWGPML